jgi:hypothetical protein
MVGDVLREHVLPLTIGILIFLLLFTLYYVSINPPIESQQPSENKLSIPE